MYNFGVDGVEARFACGCRALRAHLGGGSPILAASVGGSRDWSERRERIIHLNVRSSSYKIKAIAASGGSDACISALTCITALMHGCGSAGAHGPTGIDAHSVRSIHDCICGPRRHRRVPGL